MTPGPFLDSNVNVPAFPCGPSRINANKLFLKDSGAGIIPTLLTETKSPFLISLKCTLFPEENFISTLLC